MSDQTPRLTVEELEDFRYATLYSNVAGDYPAEMTSRLRAYTNEPDGGLINLIDMATGMARDLEKCTAAVFHESRNVDRIIEQRTSSPVRPSDDRPKLEPPMTISINEQSHQDDLRARSIQLARERGRIRE